MSQVEKEFTIVNEYGFHARPAARFVKIAAEYQSEVWIEKDGYRMNGKSIMGLLAMEAARGSVVKLSTDGDDAEAMMTALGDLIERGFDDVEPEG